MKLYRGKAIAWLLTLCMLFSVFAAADLSTDAAGKVKYLQLKKTDTAAVINYSMLKNLQGFLSDGYDSVSLRAKMKIDNIDGADGIQVYRTGTWRDFGYFRKDGENGIKYVVKGADATNASGAAVPAETEFKGMSIGKWYDYDFTFTMKEPYTVTITVKDGETAVISPLTWQDISERGNFALQFRTNTQVAMDVKELKVVGKKVTGETVIEDRTYEDVPEGNYYGGTTDGVGGIDNKTRTSKLIVLDNSEPPTPPTPPTPGPSEGGKELTFTKTDSSTTDPTYGLFYYALKNLKSYADGIYDSVTFRFEIKVNSLSGDYSDGIEIFRSGSWADYGLLRADGADGVKYALRGSGVQTEDGAPAAAEYTGMKVGEWVKCEFNFGMKSPYKTTITLSNSAGTPFMKAIWPDISDRGNFGIGIRPNTLASMSLRNIQVVGISGGGESEIENRDFASVPEGEYTGGATDQITGANGTSRTAVISGSSVPGGEDPELPPLEEGAVVLERRTFQRDVLGPYTNSIALGDPTKAAANVVQDGDNRYLELKQTQTGNKLLYYILKGLPNYGQKYDKIILNFDFLMKDFTPESNGVKMWTFAQSFGFFTQKDRVNYKPGGIANPDLVPGGLAAGEWLPCKIIFDFGNAKMKFMLGNAEKEVDFTAVGSGNLALEFDSASTGIFGVDNIVVSGIEAGDDPIPPLDQTEFYVAQNGSDDNDGTLEKPFLTIDKAKETVRRAVANPNLEKGPITVYIRGGVYPIGKTVNFAGSDSGTEKNPVVYRPYGNEKVRFTGGVTIPASAVKPVTDTAILNRLVDVQARKHLMQIDLAAAGISNIPQIDDHGFGGNMPSSFQNYRPFDVYFNGQALLRSRYPNDEPNTAFLRTGNAITAGSTTSPFTIEYKDPDDRTKQWDFSKMKDLFISGFIGNDWAGVNHRVAALDTDKKQLTSQYGSSYPATANHRLYFWNLLEEIDLPGESYIDRENKILYFYPPSETADAQITAPTFDGVMFQFSGCKNVTFKGFTCDTTFNRMVMMTGCTNVALEDCIFAHGSTGAITVNGGKCAVRNCHIYDMGAGGIVVNGGDPNNLTPAANVIENNRIHNFNRVYNSSVPGIAVSGVGQIIRNNAVYDAPHILIQLNSAINPLIEYNEIYNGALEASDIGAIYWGRKPEEVGVTIRYNFFHDIGNQYGGYGQTCVFYDDGAIGPEMYGNVMYRGTRTADQGGNSSNCFALKTHGGQYGNIRNNIFIDMPLAFRIQPWNNAGTDLQTRWWLWVQNTVNPMSRIRSKAWLDYYKGTIWEKYQKNFNETTYQQLMAMAPINPTKPTTAQFNLAKNHSPRVTHTFTDNLAVGIGKRDGLIYWGLAEERGTVLYDDLEAGKKLFRNFDKKDFALTAEALAEIKKANPNFEDVPFDKMGLTSPVGGAAPEAGNAIVLGAASPGATLTAGYRFTDADGDSEGNSKIIWFVSDSENGEFERLPGRQGKSLYVEQSYLGKYLRYEVTPHDRNGLYGETVVSQAVQVSKGSAVDQKLKEAIMQAKELLNDLTVGQQFGQIPDSKPKDELESAINAGESANTDEKRQEALQLINIAMENAKKAVIQDASGINEGTYTVFDFMNDFEAEAEQGKGFKLSLQRGMALPKMKLSGWLTVDGTPQKATVTIPKGTIIDGTGRVELAVFMEENSTTLPINGDRFTCIILTDGQLRLSQKATLLIPNAWHKKTAYRSGNNAETIGSGTSSGYGRQKSGDADLLITTDRLGEIILYTAKAAPPKPSDNDPTPTPSPKPGGTQSGGKSKGSSGGTAVPSTPAPAPQQGFADTVGHWAEADIKDMAARGIVSGVSATAFEPDRKITRAEYAAMIVRALSLTKDNGMSFDDVMPGSWYETAVSVAASADLMVGYDNKFRPDDTITREEMAVVINKLAQMLGHEMKSGGAGKFEDRSDISPWAAEAVDNAASTGLIYGMTETTFAPRDNATRAQAVSIIKRLLDK